ncbi:(2Fe-2S)-binding protein [Paenibacillus alkalitolerans]|uniref:(2Fe-2S)-binding protein n=1 Tax=Paenibacillus alkalitolerans TaxID=2799335 RepID=UPI0018F2F3C6|nr:(2Fe-2S)-binding protein [Paenibacillus alkalitolerans]
MSGGRIVHHPVLGQLPQRREISFFYNGTAVRGYEGETVAAALLAEGVRTLRFHEETGTPRGIFCNIGHCMECRVTLNGVDGVRACLTTIEDGMDVREGRTLPAPLKKGGRSE